MLVMLGALALAQDPSEDDARWDVFDRTMAALTVPVDARAKAHAAAQARLRAMTVWEPGWPNGPVSVERAFQLVHGQLGSSEWPSCEGEPWPCGKPLIVQGHFGVVEAVVRRGRVAAVRWRTTSRSEAAAHTLRERLEDHAERVRASAEPGSGPFGGKVRWRSAAKLVGERQTWEVTLGFAGGRRARGR